MIPRLSVGRTAGFVLRVTIVPGTAALGGTQVNVFILRTYMLSRRDRGQTMAEYAIVLAVITIGILVGIGLLSGAVQGALSSTASKI
jgi:Flp pilus assembly pilin Flp